MEKKIRSVQRLELPKEEEKKAKKVYMKTFSEDMANFYVAVEARRESFPAFKTQLLDQKVHIGNRLRLAAQFFMQTSDSIRQFIKSAQQTYGYEELVQVKFDEHFVPQEPEASITKRCRGFRQRVEEKAITCMDFLDQVLKELMKYPTSIVYHTQGVDSVIKKLQELADAAIIITSEYLGFISEQKLLILDERKRACKELQFFRKRFARIFSVPESEKGQGEKRKLEDEGESGQASKPKSS